MADEVGAYLMVDMSHISGLVAGGAHANPFPHAHVVTSTTHNPPRAAFGVILWNDEELTSRSTWRFSRAQGPGCMSWLPRQ